MCGYVLQLYVCVNCRFGIGKIGNVVVDLENDFNVNGGRALRKWGGCMYGYD